MEQNPIKYSDLISPDDSIEQLIAQLQQLNEAYTNMATSVKQQASSLSASLKAVSGATTQGQQATRNAASDADKLEKAYRKLDEALGKNAKEIARLNAVRREQNNYNKMLVQRGKDEISTMKQIKEASYEQLTAQYSLNKAYINSLTATDRKIAKNKELIKQTKEIYEQMKKLQADTGKMQLNVGNYPQIGGMVATLGKYTLGVGSAAAAAMAAVSALKGGINTAMDFQHSLSVLSAILGTTKDKLGELTEQARELGSTTIFTASEVVELQTELAKLGYTTDNIIKMTPSILTFSQATGASLADAASLTGAALRMFEKDATQTQDFVDKMSASITKSALSFSYLQNAMSTVAPVANAFGFKLEEVLALLGQLANAGFDASSAATATRNILLNLADANGKLAQALGEPVTNLDDLIKGLKTLNDRGIDLGESLELTDKRSVSAFNTFLAGTDSVINLRDELSACNGVAQQMATTMGDDLTGGIKTLQSAWQDFMIELNGDQGLLSGIIQLLTNLVKAINKPFKWFNKRTAEKRKQAISNAEWNNLLDADVDNASSGNYTIYVPNEGATGGGTAQTKTTTNTTKTTKKKGSQKSQQAAAKAALKEQEKQQRQALEIRRAYEDALLELIDDEETKERAKIIQQYDRKIEDVRTKYGEQTELITKLEEVKQAKLADIVEKNAKKQQEQADRQAKENERKRIENVRKEEKSIEAAYDLSMSYAELEENENKKTQMRLQAEKERLQKLIALYQQDGKVLTETELAVIKNNIAQIDKELAKNKKDKDIYDLMGFSFNDEQKQALNDAFAMATEQLSNYMQAYVEAAEKRLEYADKEVDRTKSALDAEIEARNNGYAANVALAQKEYDNAKKNQQKALQEQRRAQKAQEMIDTATQVSSLITATANIWKAFSSGGPWGIAAAIAATALMFGSFAAAKIKAASVSGMGTGEEEYGEGTVELLEGGSHQSGNDIDLGRKRNGVRRRAEGGEFFAVINKRNSRRYRSVIPEVIGSLNDGTFAQKYQRAYEGGSMNVNVQTRSEELVRLSDDVRSIREQGERNRYVDGNGNTVETYKNLRRIIRNH